MSQTEYQRRYAWLHRFSDSTEDIGGRATDVSQLACSLEERLESAFPVNAVPPALAAQMEIVKRTCLVAEQSIAAIIESISDSLSRSDP